MGCVRVCVAFVCVMGNSFAGACFILALLGEAWNLLGCLIIMVQNTAQSGLRGAMFCCYSRAVFQFLAFSVFLPA